MGNKSQENTQDKSHTGVTYPVTSTGVDGRSALFVHRNDSASFVRDADKSCQDKIAKLRESGKEIEFRDINTDGSGIVYKFTVYEHDGDVSEVGVYSSLDVARESAFNYMKWFYLGRVPESTVGVDDLISGLRSEGFTEHNGAMLKVQMLEGDKNNKNHNKATAVMGSAWVMLVNTQCVTLGGEFAQCYLIEQVLVDTSVSTNFF